LAIVLVPDSFSYRNEVALKIVDGYSGVLRSSLKHSELRRRWNIGMRIGLTLLSGERALKSDHRSDQLSTIELALGEERLPDWISRILLLSIA